MKQIPLLCALFILFSARLTAQDFMMQGWYWDYPKTASNPTANWADTIKNKAAQLSNAGFTHMWLPPLSNSSSGNFSNGYNPRDLYDLGEYSGPTGFGTRQGVDECIAALNANGIDAVADVVYNHRDGGLPEVNPAVEGWIENYTCTKKNSGDAPYPSDRFQCIIPLGGASLNGAGTYYFKIASASKHPDFYGSKYKIYMWTSVAGFQNQPPLIEQEPNGGSDCGQASNPTFLQLGRDMEAFIDNVGSCGGSCGVDEFGLTLAPGQFNPAGDTLRIVLTNVNSGYTDHFIYSIWSVARNQDIQSEMRYLTYTNFNPMPSGRGGMDWSYFRPNGNPTQLNGDLDFMWFFYDYDQTEQKLRDSLSVWTEWLWDDVGIRGLRLDAVKHFPPSYVGELMNRMHAAGRTPNMVVGEFFDGNPGLLNNWITQVYANMNPAAANAIKVRLFDFNLRQALKDACDAFGYDVRNVFNSGMVRAAGSSPFNVVTFANNHDYRDPGQPIQNSPMLAYAYILTNNQVGLPCVYYPDYYGTPIPNTPTINMKPQIDKLMKVHKQSIFGATGIDYLSRFSTPYAQSFGGGFPNTTLVYQLGGTPSGKNVVVAINFAGGTDTLKLDQGVNTSGGAFTLSQGDTLMDVLKRSKFPYARVDFLNRIYIQLPPRDYSVWVACNIPLAPVVLANQSICAGSLLPAPLAVQGIAGYSYRWYGAATGEASLIAEGTNTYTPTLPLPPGVYEYWVEAVNQQGCYSLTRTKVTLTVYPSPTLSVAFVGNATCFGSNNGQATLTADNGTQPYNYLWSDGLNTNSATRLNIPAGSYTVTVSDVNACSATTTLSIAQPPFITNPVTVRAKVLLQAPYNTSGGLMSTQLLLNGYLPTAQPYNTAPWNYAGNECVQTLPPGTVDWVLVEVRSAANNNTIIARRAALLRNDGVITDLSGAEGVAFGSLTSGNTYFISVKHRNHVGLLSASPVALPNTTTYDLTNAANINQFAGQAALLNPGVYGMYAGDVNGNGVVTYADFNVFIATIPGMGGNYQRADTNLDGNVDITDFNWYRTNAGVTGINQVRQ
ncbi:MAG TPA: alpha-amylase family glycosyl hydrolase [Chitinophagales bacterium]|nr:alpha-amylase family glycosyl hydrolase [Chitinophagales bacterium]HRK25911.1 alpha-amylase family glycosyl hydrolase [Chitinophagales bacterium]